MNVQRLAVGVVIDAAEGEILQFLPDFIGWRDQTARPPDGGEMPECQHRQRKRHRQQYRPQPRPPDCRPRHLARRRGIAFGIGRQRGHGQVGFIASTKLASMKVAKSGNRLICFSASMWSA